MIHTQTEIDNLVELAIIQRAELKRLVESLPQLREHLSSEIERNLEEIEPAIRSELEQFVAARASDAHAQTSAALTAKIDELARSLETTTAARYSVLMVEREKNERFAQLAEQKIAAAAAELPTNVKSIVLDELSRFPRANQIDQLRKEFAEPASLNPRGKWQAGEIYNKLDLVSLNGSSFIANETTSEKPSSASDQWTLSASRGNSSSGGGVTSLTDLVLIPNNGELLIGNGTGFVESTLTAGSGISITNGAGSITVTATGGVNFQGSWNASTNTPTLTSSVGTTGFFYIVSVAGSTNLNGITDWEIGDWAIFGTSTWTKVDNTDKVSSVFGRVGSVVGVSTDYSAVGITNTALGASNPSTVAATTISATSTISATGAVTGSNLSGTNTGDQTNITGNAATATALQTARNINGVSFNGTANITVTAAGSTLSDTVTIAKGGTGQITAQAALNALLPSQVGATGKNLQSDGTNVSFVADAGGTVTSVSVSTANGVSGTVATSTTTPAISLTLGAITPTSVAASGSVTGSNLSGTNTGDQTITLTGDVTGSGTGSFATAIGSGVIVDADVNASAAIAYSKLNLATSIVNADISGSAAIVDTKLATISTASKVSNSATTATNANTASAIVARDASGNFSAGTITANLTGNVSGSSGSTTGNAATATALQTARAINGVNFDGTAAITVTADASTLTSSTLASGVTASSLTSVGTLAALTVTAPITGSVTGSSGSTTGNAATATALATGRTIAITGDLAYTSPSFDGSGNVTAAGTLASVASAGTSGGSTAIPIVTINAKGLTTSITTAAVIAPASTLTGATLASGVTASSLTSLGTIANLAVTAGTISGTPSASTDIANKLYVDTVAQGLDAKGSCVAATTANITLSGTQTVDGIVLIAGDRVLVKDQTLSQNNGIYLCAAGAWTRTTDADTWDELTSAFTFIENGTVNADIGYVCTADAGGTLGTTALPWSQISGAGSYTASTGLTLTGSAFSLTAPVTVALGGTNATSAGIGSFNNITGYTAAGATGTTSTNLVFSTSPTLITPDLGTPTALVGTNISGTAAGLTAGNVTTNANLTGVITSSGNATSIASQTGTGSTFVVNTSPTLVTPLLGTPTSVTLTNATGLPLTTGVTGTLPVANGGTGITSLGSGIATFLGTPSSANLASAVTDETGSGSLVFATSPTLVTPNIGVATGTSLAAALNGTLGATTPSSVAATTGTFSSTLGVTGVATLGNGAILGTPASGTVTNLTGTASININGTVGATTPSTIAATTVTATGTISSTVGNAGTAFDSQSATTGYIHGVHIKNTSGELYLGLEGTTAGTLITGDSAYDTTVRSLTPISFSANGGSALHARITSTGLNSTAIGATTPASVAATTGTFSSTLDVSGVVGIGGASNAAYGILVSSALSGTGVACYFQPTQTATGNSNTLVMTQYAGTFAKSTFTGLTTKNLFIGTPSTSGAGTIATSYQIQIAAGVAGTTTYGIYQDGTDQNYFAGTLTSNQTVSDAIGNLRLIPQNSQSAAYTLVLADSGKHILHPSADTTARTFTIPANSTVAFTIGTAVTFINQNAGGVITISITTDTMRLAGAGTTGSRSLAANGVATAVKITSTEWIISGTGLT